jgi:DNA adenine methylase/adenine-specific DNA-methyltransferase
MQAIAAEYKSSILERMANFPTIRYMGSKNKLVPWIYDTLNEIEFSTVLDAFSGSGVVSYLFKSMGKRVYSNDFLHFSSLMAKGLVENSEDILIQKDVETLFSDDFESEYFILKTFKDIFYNPKDLQFLDKVSANIKKLKSQQKRALAYTALFRSCVKKQPRGVFTVSGDLERYDDGRRDLKLSLADHFHEQINIYNELVFDNGRKNLSFNQSIFDFNDQLYKPDLVYFDPPYVPKSDDNCYIKRYHFLEGLSKYWHGEVIMENTKVKKIQKKFTPFSYRRTSIEAFDKLFEKFSKSTLALSYSSNAFPDLGTLVGIMNKHKSKVVVHEKPYRYHFGNHVNVNRALVQEYLIIGT